MHNTKFTKIVTTIGPATETAEMMGHLIDAGANIFRFNTKHSTPEWHDEHIKLAQKVADQKGATLGILLDLQGPEIRLETKDKQTIKVVKDQQLLIGTSFSGDVSVIIPHRVVFEIMKKGDELLIDDGFVETEVVAVTDESLVVKVKNDSVIKHRKGVNLPGKDIDFPSLIDNDIAQIKTNARNKVDFVGLSFVRSAADIKLLRQEMASHHMTSKIVAKIESQPALDRIDEIIAEADAVMVARGDLGVEVPIEQLAYWQKTIIDKCRIANKPVITATQMLESMISNPRPTRAEATDVAHAIMDGTDAIMLSAESASGTYPIRCVETMAKIAKWNERLLDHEQKSFAQKDATTSIAEAAAKLATSQLSPRIDAVVVFTESGFTAHAIARYRLPVPIIAVTDRQQTAEAMTIGYGITPVVVEFPTGDYTGADEVIKSLKSQDYIHPGDTVLVVHGEHWKKSGTTNALAIQTA